MFPKKTLFLGTALILSTLSVAAGELDAFVQARDGATACWSRSYSAQHLREHPHQQVTAMDLTVTYMEETAMSPDQYVFRLEAQLRDGTEGYAVGPCMAQGGKMWCGVECDGGGVLVSNRNGGDILVDLAAVGAIAMSTSCGEDDFDSGFSLQSGIDDKTFLLHPQPVQICEPARY